MLSPRTIELIKAAHLLAGEMARTGLSAEQYYDHFLARRLGPKGNWRYRPIDGDGWTVPRPRTIARTIYELAKYGYGPDEISAITKEYPQTIGTKDENAPGLR